MIVVSQSLTLDKAEFERERKGRDFGSQPDLMFWKNTPGSERERELRLTKENYVIRRNIEIRKNQERRIFSNPL
mgnify:CR=1 FL=1